MNRGKGRYDNRDTNTGEFVKVGEFSHITENAIVIKTVSDGILPKYFVKIFTQSQTVVGTVCDVLGRVEESMFVVATPQGLDVKKLKKGEDMYTYSGNCIALSRFNEIEAPVKKTKKPVQKGPQRPQGGRPTFNRGGGNRGAPQQRGRGGFRPK